MAGQNRCWRHWFTGWGGVNSSGFRVMSAWTRSNSCCRDFWGCVGMERLNGAVNEKNIEIWRSVMRTNLGLVILVVCAFNEVHGSTRD